MTPCPQNIEIIVGALSSGLETDFHFRCLYERYFSRLRLFFLRKRLLPDDALELTQEVFFSVYQNIDMLREAKDFDAWLYRIALNIFRNHLEKNRAVKRSGTVVSIDNSDDEKNGVEEIAAEILTPLENLLEIERKQSFEIAINELPEQMRKVFYLKVAREMTSAEISAILGISVNTVKAHVFQARQKLRERLLKEEISDS